MLSDYDGTLTPIVERPEDAELSGASRYLLEVLAHQRRYTVGIISGRALSDLKARVGVKRVIYAGNHGLEIEGPDFDFVHPVAREVKDVFNALVQVLRKGLNSISGAIVEHKGLTLSVHYRLVDEDRVAEVKDVVEQTVDVPKLLGQVKTTQGKKVYELRPAVDWHKGKAVSLILANRRYGPETRPTVVFLGDDFTDEDGFAAVEKLGGITILVGEDMPETRASYYLRSPGEVQEFLGRLVDAERRKMG